MILIFVLYAFLGATFTIGKEALLYVPPIFFIGLRMVIAGLLLLGYVKFYKKQSFKFKFKLSHLYWILAVAFFQFYLSFTLEFVSLKYLTSAKTCLLYNLSPIITALLSYFVFKEFMTMKKWAGLGIGFLGFFPLLLAQAPSDENILGTIGFISIPELLMFGAVVTSCISWIAMKKLTKEYKYCLFFINGL